MRISKNNYIRMKNLSYLNNANSAYIDSLYQLYKEDPASVEFGWQKFFEGFDFGQTNTIPGIGMLSLAGRNSLKVSTLAAVLRQGW